MAQLDTTMLGQSVAVPIPPSILSFSPSTAGTEGLREVAHEVRNMVAALGLYCDLLETPGVLAPAYQHYGNELKMVVATGRRLVERMVVMGSTESAQPGHATPFNALPAVQGSSSAMTALEELPPVWINDLASELHAMRNLLSALAGPAITMHLDLQDGALPVRMNSEDLTRILVNLIKNAAEAMPNGGKIQLVLRESQTGPEQQPLLLLNVEDTGLGIPAGVLDRIFQSGFTTRAGRSSDSPDAWRRHRGLGLAITRSIVESAGGHIHAANRDPFGACFQIELPVRGA
jgi:signal transduction histidine kinase